VFVLDRALEPVPVGVAGELFIAGVGLARGYLSRPGLTGERFLPCPFPLRPGERCYRTGDLVRWRPDGNLEFLGRLDEQVKIRGFRVEPGEVEAALAAHPAVAACAVVAGEHERGERQLLAYLVARGPTPTSSELRTFLRHRLPDYMLPSHYQTLPTLPLTANGKLDRAALPAPSRDRPTLTHPYTPPRTATETTIAQIWATVLARDQIGIHDNFFELGGHSLLATQVLVRLRQAFATELPLRALFEAPTIAELADTITAALREHVAALADDDVHALLAAAQPGSDRHD
jgi:acyl carrier protein